MSMSNKTYDVLKWIAMYLLPAAGTLYFALAGIWNLPYGEQVVGTITAVDTFLGVILGISTSQYNKATDKENTVPQGYHDGSGKVSIDATEQAKLIATNIREGVTILGVEGAMSGSEDMKPQSKEVTPSKEAQTIMPDEEYNCLSQVTVKAIPYVETDNSAGGKTVTIG